MLNIGSESEYSGVKRSKNGLNFDSEDEMPTVSLKKKELNAPKTSKRKLPTTRCGSEDEASNVSLKKKELNAPKTSKRKLPTTRRGSCFDSEDEVSDVSSKKKESKATTATSKRKLPSTSDTRKRATPATAASKTWSLESDSDEDVAAALQQRPTTPFLQSVLTRRVADGVLRRTAQLNGDHFLELKLYNTKDILTTDPKDRWEKAVLNLKLQADGDAPELELLRQFVLACKRHFTNEGTFFLTRKERK